MKADVLLVPIDLASPTQAIVALACTLARALDCVVTLLHVVHLPVGVPPAGALPLGLIDTETAMDVLDEEAGRRLQELSKEFLAAQLPVSHVVRHGEPAMTIAAVAEELKVRHIVMGTHGRQGLERFLLGSVADRVLRKAACPVTIVHIPDEVEEAP